MRKRALVTGGSGAIGAAICRRLAADGFEVVVHANRNLESARRLADDIGGSAVAFDVVDAPASLAALESVLEAGPIQVLVNNAGVHDDAAFPGMKREQWGRVIAVATRRLLQRDASALAADDPHALGTNHQHHVGDCGDRQPRPDQLRRGEGRAARGHVDRSLASWRAAGSR